MKGPQRPYQENKIGLAARDFHRPIPPKGIFVSTAFGMCRCHDYIADCKIRHAPILLVRAAPPRGYSIRYTVTQIPDMVIPLADQHRFLVYTSIDYPESSSTDMQIC